MKILHSADLHIGKSAHIFPETYLARQTKMLYDMLDIARKQKVDIIAFGGDIFEVGQPTQDEKDVWLKWVAAVNRAGIYLLVVPGNHDEDRADKTALDSLGYFHDTLNFVKIALYKPEVFWFKGYCIAMIPWQFDAVKTAKELYEGLKKKPKKFIVLTHLTLPGIPAETGYVLPGNHKYLLKCKFVDAWLLGDIHKRYISPCGRIQMPGSPIQHIWKDSLPKGVSIIKGIKLNKPELVGLDVPTIAVAKSLKEAKKMAKKGHIIKLVTNEIISDEDLPEGVVDVANYYDEQELIDFASDVDYLDGLVPYLASKGLTKKQQKYSVRVIKKISEGL